MGRFILENDYHFLSFHDIYEKAASSSLPSLFDCVAVLEMYQVSNGIVMFRDYNYTAHFHPQKTHGYAFGNDIKVQNELEIYGVVIRGEKLQTLIEELKNASKCLKVNRQGLCLMAMGTVWHNIGAYYPVYELFDWRKYGVNVPNTPTELWSSQSGMTMLLPPPRSFTSLDNAPSESVDQSKKIILNAPNLFVSCNRSGGGPLYLWKVDNPSGQIRNVQFLGRIDCHRDMSRLEVNGVTLQGGKLRSLGSELAMGRMMINASGWCLVVNSMHGLYGNYYLKLLFRFDWERYGVPTFIWPGGNKYYLDKVQVTGVELLNGEAGVKEEFYQKEDELKDLGLELEKTKKEFYHVEKELKDLGLELEKTKKELYQKEKERKDLSLELEKTKKEFFQKEKERKYLESHLQEKEKDLRLCEKQLDEKDQESKKLTKRLHVVQNEVIIGSIYREYCSNDSFEKRLQNLSAVSRETHVVLAFARDYDDWDSHTNGIFKVFFDQNMTPLMIANFKRDSPTAKFFLCIGDRSQRYPFDVTDKHTWIINATTSLKCIIQEYGFHGIDVYYTRSNTNADDFIYAIGTVIDTLMTQQIITTASIAPCSFMHGPDCKFYAGLYNRNPMNFEFVVFQTHDDDNDIPMNDAEQLINIFNKLASDDNFPKEKLVAGHSILPKDWDTLPYPVILTALPQLIESGVVQGTSVWTLTDDQP